MERIRFDRTDARFIVVCLLVIAICTWFSLTQFRNAFPEASIDFRYDRKEAGKIAETFLERMDLAVPDGYRLSSRFGFDSWAKTYLEKELGLEKAQPYFGNPVRLWFWQYRWFCPSTKEEFSVYVTPGGEVVRLRHLVDEEAAGAKLEEDSARVLAKEFLLETMQLDLESIVFWEASKLGRPNRSDWNVTFKAQGIEPVEGSDYRYRVTILGDRIGEYREYLHVPEEWEAGYKKLRSYNELSSTFAGVGLLLTIIAIVAVIVMKLRGHDIRWKTAMVFGIIMTVLMFLNQLNFIPIALYGYDTTASWSGFLVQTLLESLLISIGGGVFIFTLTAGAETMFRERYPKLPALPTMFTPRGLRTKSAFKGILLGITLTPFFFAYQIVFYLISQHYGGWSPADVPYSNLLNTAMPWLAVLLIGFMPAVSEEFMSRMFSIPFLEKLFRSKFRWLAILIPAIIWGFAHANYPSQPFWIRGVEVGIGGIIIGIVMLRFGILAPLVWHYTVDAFYTALLFFRSDNSYFIITGAVGAGLLVLPLLAALIAYLRSGTFLPEKGTLNNDFPAPEIQPRMVEPSAETITSMEGDKSARPLSRTLRIVAVLILLAGIATLFFPVRRVGDYIKFPVSHKQAVATFADSLRATGWADPDTMRLVAFTNDNQAGMSQLYLLKQLKSVDEFNRLYDSTLSGGDFYKINAWVPENRLRFTGSVNSRSGKLESLFPILPEEMEGDSLSEDSARILVETILERHGEDLSTLKLESHFEHTRPNRLDHKFVYEAHEGDPRHIGEARYRNSGWVKGNWASASVRPWYKVPESWTRDRKATTTPRTIRQYSIYILRAVFIGLAIALLVVQARKGLVPWKKAFTLAVIPAALALPNTVNIIYLAQREYLRQIAIPWHVFKSTSYISAFVAILMFYILFALGFALLGGLYHDKRMLLNGVSRKKSALESLYAIFAGLGALLIVRELTSLLSFHKPEWIAFGGWQVPSWLTLPLPIAAMVHSALGQWMLIIVALALLAYFWKGLFNKPVIRALLLVVVVVALTSTSTKESVEWSLSAIFRILVVLVAWDVLHFFVRGRPAGLISLAWIIATFNISGPAILTGNPTLIIQGWAFVVLSTGTLAWWLFGARVKKPM